MKAMRTGLLMLLPIWACIGTNTGNPADEDHGDLGETSFDRCEETITTLGSLQEEAPNGLRGADLLALAEGTHEETLRWGSSNSSIEVGPEEGDHALTVDLRYEGGEIRFVERMRDPDDHLTDVVHCPDHLELGVQVEMRTDESALDEMFDATLRGEPNGQVSLSVDLDPNALNGSLMLDTSEEGFELRRIGVSIAFNEYGSQGRLSASFEKETDDAVSMSAGSAGGVAHWPAGSPCRLSQPAIAPDEAYAEFSARDAVAAANDHAPLQLTWKNGTQASVRMELGVEDDMVCAFAVEEGYGPAGTLRFAGTLDVESDGGWSARFPVYLTAVATEDGALDALELSAAEGGPTDVTESELEQTYGFADLETEGFESLAMEIDGTFSANGSPVEGELHVYGYEPPDCPPDPDPDDQMAPGCPGATRVEIESAFWTSE